MKEYCVIGPPGTGKTTYLRRQIGLAASRFGAGKVVVCSLTRTAAANIAEAGAAIPRENIGTIHSFAYKAIPGVQIADIQVDLFNAFCAERKQPMMKLSGGKVKPNLDNEDVVEIPSAGATLGDACLAEANRFRARLIRRELWPDNVRSFETLWSQWKRDSGFVDFTDLLEIAYRDVSECPGSPAAFFADESQDFSRLAFALVRKWGEKAITFVQVGDPDQVLYQWAGADPGAFFASAVPEDQRSVLKRSFRVPRKVHAAALRWIDQTPNRKPVAYLPRDHEGEIRRSIATSAHPEMAVLSAKKHVEAGKTVMFLTTCSYMLGPTIACLRGLGIPFHNPYRVTRGDWNPLRIGATSPAARLAAFVKSSSKYRGEHWEDWNNKDVRLWTEWLNTKDYFVRGAKTDIEDKAKEDPTGVLNVLDVYNYFLINHLEPISEVDETWWLSNIDAKHKDKADYPVKLLQTGGYASLTETPKVIVSTIHGAKGGEADVCYVFPDLSPNAYNEWTSGGDGKEGIRRAFYVALTRVRDILVLCSPSSNMSVRL